MKVFLFSKMENDVIKIYQNCPSFGRAGALWRSSYTALPRFHRIARAALHSVRPPAPSEERPNTERTHWGRSVIRRGNEKKNASKRKQHSETRALGESVSAVPRSPFGKTRLHEFYQNILSTACSRPRLGAAFLSPESMRGYFHKVFRKCYLPATIAKRAKGRCRFYTGRTLGRWRFAHFFWT